MSFAVLLSGCAAQKKTVAEISTPLGTMDVYLYEATPKHRENFMNLVKSGYWNGQLFNRVIPNFVAQGGCPDTPEGFKDTSLLLAPEIMPQLKHLYGALGAGRDDNAQKNSARCQIYIVQNRDDLRRLDGDYTVFGQVIRGMEVVDKIVAAPRNDQDAPLQNIAMQVRLKKMRLSKEIIKTLQAQ